MTVKRRFIKSDYRNFLNLYASRSWFVSRAPQCNDAVMPYTLQPLEGQGLISGLKLNATGFRAMSDMIIG